MSKTIGIIIAIVVIVGGLYLLMSRAPTTTDINSNTSDTSGAQGRVVFSVTDAAVNMNTISEIDITVRSVAIQSGTDGWVTVSTTPRTFSLLELNAENKSELLADVNTDVGTYNQVRLMIDSVKVTTKAGVTKEAKLPSGELGINTVVLVNANTTASVNFDFLANKSLHMTSSGDYIFAPVVKIETKSDADVNIDADSKVVIAGGLVNDTSTVGMDIDGSVKLNFEINANQKLNIGSDNRIKIEGLLQ